MSTVTLIVVEGRSIHYVQAHWRTIKALLDSGFEGVFWQKHEQAWEEHLDAGYILIDLNRNTLVNCQEAFAVKLPGFNIVSA